MFSNIISDTRLEIAHAIFDKHFYLNNIKYLDSDGNTVLHLLFIKHTNEFSNEEENQANIIHILEKIIEDYPESMIHQNNSGLYPIHLACFNGNIEAVKFMVDIVSKSFLFKSTDDMIPLHFAILGGHFTLVQYLSSLDITTLYLHTNDDLNAEGLATKCNHIHIVDHLKKIRLQFEIIKDMRSFVTHLCNSSITNVHEEYSIILQNNKLQRYPNKSNDASPEEILIDKYLHISEDQTNIMSLDSDNQKDLSNIKDKINMNDNIKELSIENNLPMVLDTTDSNLQSITEYDSSNQENNTTQKLPKLYSTFEYLRINAANHMDNIPLTISTTTNINSNIDSILNQNNLNKYNNNNQNQNQIFDDNEKNVTNINETTRIKSPSIPKSSKVFIKQQNSEKLSFASPRKIIPTSPLSSVTPSTTLKLDDFIQSRKIYGSNTVSIVNFDIKSNLETINENKIVDRIDNSYSKPKHIIYQDFSYSNEEKILLDYYFTNTSMLSEYIIQEDQSLNNIILPTDNNNNNNNNINNNNNNINLEKLVKGSELETSSKYQHKKFHPLPVKQMKQINKSPAALKNINLKQMVKKVKNIIKKTNDELLSESIHVSDYRDESSNITLLSTQPLNSMISINTTTTLNNNNDFVPISSPAIINNKKNIMNNKIDYNKQNFENEFDHNTSPLSKRKLTVVVKLDTKMMKNPI